MIASQCYMRRRSMTILLELVGMGSFALSSFNFTIGMYMDFIAYSWELVPQVTIYISDILESDIKQQMHLNWL